MTVPLHINIASVTQVYIVVMVNDTNTYNCRRIYFILNGTIYSLGPKLRIHRTIPRQLSTGKTTVEQAMGSLNRKIIKRDIVCFCRKPSNKGMYVCCISSQASCTLDLTVDGGNGISHQLIPFNNMD